MRGLAWLSLHVVVPTLGSLRLCLYSFFSTPFIGFVEEAYRSKRACHLIGCATISAKLPTGTVTITTWKFGVELRWRRR
jgi:hypothetical protein